MPRDRLVAGIQSPRSGGEHLERQGLLVHLDAPVAAAGQRRDVAAHVLLQEARRLLHGLLLGGLDRVQRRLVDAQAPLKELLPLLRRGQPLGHAGDRLRVDVVGVHATAGLALLAECGVALPPRGVHRGAQADPVGRGVLAIVAHAGQRVARLRGLGRGRVAQVGQVPVQLEVAEHAALLGLEPLDGPDVLRLRVEELLRAGHVADVQRGQQRVAIPLRGTHPVAPLRAALGVPLHLGLEQLVAAPHVRGQARIRQPRTKSTTPAMANGNAITSRKIEPLTSPKIPSPMPPTTISAPRIAQSVQLLGTGAAW